MQNKTTKRWVLFYAWAFFIGCVLGMTSYTLHTWQYWAISLPCDTLPLIYVFWRGDREGGLLPGETDDYAT